MIKSKERKNVLSTMPILLMISIQDKTFYIFIISNSFRRESGWLGGWLGERSDNS